MANISIIGSGYVGLVSGACLADFGNSVVCIDIDTDKVNRLKSGEVPIFEPGLDHVIQRNVSEGRLSFSHDLKKGVVENPIVFIAVGTPSAPDGSADLSYVEAVARSIGASMVAYTIIVDKSTVPIGTGKRVKAIIQEELDKRGLRVEFDVVSNPEFLREGTAVYDFTHPDRVVLGCESAKALSIMKDVYRVLYLNETPFIEVNIETAEMIKYASNAFLAVKITFINEIANLCEAVGANVQDVARAVGKDGRIGPKFLHAGPGYGGSCFPKDTQALAHTGKKFGSPLSLVEATIKANEAQKYRMVSKIERVLGSAREKTIAVLGLSFKPNTDDIRDSPAITIIESLIAKGARLRLFDPEAMQETKKRIHPGPNVFYCQDEYDCVSQADAIILATEWNQFRTLDLARVKTKLRGLNFFDLRNVYQRDKLEALGFRYEGVGQ